jgi:hypothetical protein
LFDAAVKEFRSTTIKPCTDGNGNYRHWDDCFSVMDDEMYFWFNVGTDGSTRCRKTTI